MRYILVFCLSWATLQLAAQKVYTPSIETCGCDFKVDSSFTRNFPEKFRSDLTFTHRVDSSIKMACGYLKVPENRKDKKSRMIRLPFIILKSKQPGRHNDPLLFTSGGPGNSSLGWVNGISKSNIINERDCIAFEQRGTKFAIPYLRDLVLDSVMREAYRRNLPKDSMWMHGVHLYKQRLLHKGIDLKGYNSDETVADIADLLKVLKIDSINLIGGSYSGGLMMAVAQKIPGKVRSAILDSPLPMFSPIDEDEPKHFMEALHELSNRADKDSADSRYKKLEEQFHRYFLSIHHQTFTVDYNDTLLKKTIPIQYTKNELLEIIVGAMLDFNQLKDVPYMITEMIRGNHRPFIYPKIDRLLTKYPAPDGMRMLVYCADQAAYHDERIIQQLYLLYPYLEGFRINDVWKKVCDCWDVPPVDPVTKKPFYSPVPVFIGDGIMDPACSPLYMQQLKHYLPNAQTFLFLDRSHGISGKTFAAMAEAFINNPYQQLQSKDERVIPY
jgi:pimeloyl-ACP methyl ester carboxylesterase